MKKRSYVKPEMKDLKSSMLKAWAGDTSPLGFCFNGPDASGRCVSGTTVQNLVDCELGSNAHDDCVNGTGVWACTTGPEATG